MRANIADYNAVVEAASKFTRSVAEGNSKYAKELFTEDACLFGFLNGKFERGRCAAGSTSRNGLNHTSNDWTATVFSSATMSRSFHWTSGKLFRMRLTTLRYPSAP